jgi:DNA-directed RNA polymerase subunit beta'
MRTFHIGGTVNERRGERDRAKKGGVVGSPHAVVRNEEGDERRADPQRRNLDPRPKGRELEKYEVPTGAVLMVRRTRKSKPATVLCQWDPHSIPILAEISGKVRYEDVVEGETMRIERTPAAHPPHDDHRAQGRSAPADRARRRRRQAARRLLPAGTATSRSEGNRHSGRRHVLAKTPREASGVTGHHRRSAAGHRDLRGPQAQGSGRDRRDRRRGRDLGEKTRGKRTIVVRSESGIEREHLVSHGKRFLVHAGDLVKAGEALVDGPLVPHDILRISGEEAVQQYLVHEIQQVYRSQRVEINDKHIEIIVARMLRKVRVEHARRHQPAARDW